MADTVHNPADVPLVAVSCGLSEVGATSGPAYAGDFRQYVILDRVGLSVHFVPPGVLQNTSNNRPDGRVGWYAYMRVGADMLTIDAFRVLNLATTA